MRYLGSFNFMERTVKIVITKNDNTEPKTEYFTVVFIFLLERNKTIIATINKTPVVRSAGFKTNSSISFSILFNIY